MSALITPTWCFKREQSRQAEETQDGDEIKRRDLFLTAHQRARVSVYWEYQVPAAIIFPFASDVPISRRARHFNRMIIVSVLRPGYAKRFGILMLGVGAGIFKSHGAS